MAPRAPAAAPTRDAFGLPERTLVPRDQLGALSALEEDGVAPDLSPNFLEMLAREKRYQAAKARWKQFQQWRRTRNPRRSALEKKFGYDTKHAMHLVRLQRMAREILETGAVQVRRPDRAELLAIRDGAWSHAELVERAEANQLAIQHAMTNSSLPVSVDEDAIEALGVSIVQEVLG